MNNRFSKELKKSQKQSHSSNMPLILSKKAPPINETNQDFDDIPEFYDVPKDLSSFLLIPTKLISNLDVSNRPLTDFRGIEYFQRLKVLNASGTKIASFLGSAKLPSLKVIDLTNTPICSTPNFTNYILKLFGSQIININGKPVNDNVQVSKFFIDQQKRTELVSLIKNRPATIKNLASAQIKLKFAQSQIRELQGNNIILHEDNHLAEDNQELIKQRSELKEDIQTLEGEIITLQKELEKSESSSSEEIKMIQKMLDEIESMKQQ